MNRVFARFASLLLPSTSSSSVRLHTRITRSFSSTLVTSSLLRQPLFTDLPSRAPKQKKGTKGEDSEAAPYGGKKGNNNKKEGGGNSENTTSTTSTAGSEQQEAELPAGKDLPSSLARHLEYCRRELAKVRGATASPAMLDSVSVEAYGDRQPLSALAQITLKSPTVLFVHPFDDGLAEEIATAIRDADLGLNPSVDGKIVRVPIPKSSKESREANVKLISKIAESSKTSIRRSRQAALEKLKKPQASSGSSSSGGAAAATAGISEDDIKRESKVIEEAVAVATAEVAKLAEKKKLEVESS